jgi:glycosyltransferase involved in cell wall biosynthesis
VLKRKLLFQLFLKYVDFISFETKRSFEGASEVPADKKLLIPNGFDPDLIRHFGISRNGFEEKENAILLVARHGDHAKNSEFMFDVLLALGRLDSWKCYFIGPMTDGFRQRKDTFLTAHPQFRVSLVFTGPVGDKHQLFEYYNRSKILCVTSRSESWGMVCVEALCFGNALLMTEVNSSSDLTAEGKVGIVINQGDSTAYADALRLLMSDSSKLNNYHDNAIRHFNEHFVWKDILHDLAGRIQERQRHEKQ